MNSLRASGGGYRDRRVFLISVEMVHAGAEHQGRLGAEESRRSSRASIRRLNKAETGASRSRRDAAADEGETKKRGRMKLANTESQIVRKATHMFAEYMKAVADLHGEKVYLYFGLDEIDDMFCGGRSDSLVQDAVNYLNNVEVSRSTLAATSTAAPGELRNKCSKRKGSKSARVLAS